MLFTTIKSSFNDLWNRTLSLISADFVHDGVYTCQVRLLIIIFGIFIHPLVGILIHLLFGILIIIFVLIIDLLFVVIIPLLFDNKSNVFTGEDENGRSDPEKRGEGESDR